MEWIDLASVVILAWKLTACLDVSFSRLEKAALVLAFGLGIKSFFLFALIAFGVQPLILYQTLLALASLAILIALKKLNKTPHSLPSENLSLAEAQLPPVFVAALLVALFLLSFCNAWFFPVTETDGIWYQIRGWNYFYRVDLEALYFHNEYPPMIPLLFAYLTSIGVERIKIIFPAFYLCLTVIFYCRVLAHTRSAKTASLFTLILATTPYLWWHSVLTFLNLAAGFYFSAGILYWFFLVERIIECKSNESLSPIKSLALLSGGLLGLACWTRFEFLLYGTIPLVLLGQVLNANRALSQKSRNQILRLFFIPCFTPVAVWFAAVLGFSWISAPHFKGLLAIAVVLWIIFGLYQTGRLNREISGKQCLLLAGVLSALFILLLAFKGPKTLDPLLALLIGGYRTFAFQLFFSFSLGLAALIFLEDISRLSSAKKLLGLCMAGYLAVHFAVYTYTEPKWTEWGPYLDAVFIHPGNSANSSGTREYLALFPAFIFFISTLPVVKKSLSDD